MLAPAEAPVKHSRRRHSGRRPALVIKSPTGERCMNEPRPPSAGSIVETPPSPVMRPLTAWERLVCVPLGFMWLAILLLLAVPVCLYMTLLYFAVRAVRTLSGKGPPGGNG